MSDFPFRMVTSDTIPSDRMLLISKLSEPELDEVRARAAAGEDPIEAYADVLVKKRKVAMITGIAPLDDGPTP